MLKESANAQRGRMPEWQGLGDDCNLRLRSAQSLVIVRWAWATPAVHVLRLSADWSALVVCAQKLTTSTPGQPVHQGPTSWFATARVDKDAFLKLRTVSFQVKPADRQLNQ